MKRYVIFLLICVLFAPVLSNAEETRGDGNWWIKVNNNARGKFMSGFSFGMGLGYNFSYWGFNRDTKTANCVAKVMDSYNEHFSKYFKNVTTDQLVDGLDSFYADYRNRRIMVTGAVWLVVNGIAGTPQEELDKMIENFRRNAQ